MTSETRIGSTCICLALAASAASGATPLGAAWTYQGKLDLSGSPVNGTVDLKFSLWDDAGTGAPPAGGTQIASTQTVSNVTVVNGVFTAMLDFGFGAFEGNTRWLQIAVRSPHDPSDAQPFTTLSPRQPLAAAPYALFSAGPWNSSGGNVYYTAGRVGIGTMSPIRALDVNGGVNLTSGVIQRGGSAVTGTSDLGLYSQLSANWIRFVTTAAPFQWYTDGGAGTNPVMTLSTSGSLGIGAPNPSTRLEVYGGGGNALRVRTANRNPWAALIKNETASTEVGIYVENDGRLWINDDQATGYTSGTGYAILQFNGIWTVSSDVRLKQDIQPIGTVLDKALALRPVSYVFNGLDAEKRRERDIGLIAQEVEPLFPELVYTSKETRFGKEVKSFDYAGLSVVAIGALQELNQRMQAENATLLAQVKVLADDKAVMSRRIESLESRLKDLEAKLAAKN